MLDNEKSAWLSALFGFVTVLVSLPVTVAHEELERRSSVARLSNFRLVPSNGQRKGHLEAKQ